MADEKILKDEILKDEQLSNEELDNVAGGTRLETYSIGNKYTQKLGINPNTAPDSNQLGNVVGKRFIPPSIC